jgi:hypothetical protein
MARTGKLPMRPGRLRLFPLLEWSKNMIDKSVYCHHFRQDCRFAPSCHYRQSALDRTWRGHNLNVINSYCRARVHGLESPV